MKDVTCKNVADEETKSDDDNLNKKERDIEDDESW